MVKLKNLLLEALILYKVEVLIKTSAEENQVFIYNEIRGLPGVVVVSVDQNDYLRSKSDKRVQYALLRIKFLSKDEPKDTINKIKMDGLVNYKIPGLIQFIPRYNTLEKVGQY